MFKDAGFCTSPPPDEHFNISNGMIVSGSVFQGQVFWYSEIMKTYENIWEHVLRIPNCYLVLVWVYNCLTIIRKTGDEKIQNLQSTKPPIRIYSLGAGHSGGWRLGLFFILQQQVEHSAEPSTVIEVMRSFQLFADSFQLLRFVKISNSQYLQLSLIHSPQLLRIRSWAIPQRISTDHNGRLRPISCAYEYGVPQASGQFYHGDGPYSGGVWKAERALDELGMILEKISPGIKDRAGKSIKKR